jgi:hypothetical protein
MLPNQIFHYIDRMSRVLESMSLFERFFRRKKTEPAGEELPEYLENPNLAPLRKLFQEPQGEQHPPEEEQDLA